jgi:hypothetical protein
MRSATRVTVAAFGALAALAGIEHGVGEMLQGNVAPAGTMILSWPDSEFFRIVAGEPAMTIVPDLLVTGILATLVSLAFLVWAALFAPRKHGGLVLLLLSFVLLLVGGGFGPPLLGIIVSVAATRIDAPLAWWRTRLPRGVRRLLAAAWPWSFAVALAAWLALFPGTNIAAYYFGVDSPGLVTALILSAFGFLLLTILTGFARDIGQQAVAPQSPPSFV